MRKLLATGIMVILMISIFSASTLEMIKASPDLLTLPSVYYSYSNVPAEGSYLHGYLNWVSQQTINATSGQSISLNFSYQVFAPANPGEIVQLFFVESWTTTWTSPNGYIISVYNGGPSTSPGITRNSTISFNAPTVAGTYYLWLCVDSQYTMQDAINHKTGNMTGLPAHIKIIVTPQPATRALNVISTHGNPNPTIGNHNYTLGSTLNCSVPSPVTEGGVTYNCVGWTGTGSVPATGSGTNTSFSITQDSTITWNWLTPTASPKPSSSPTPTATPISTPSPTPIPTITPISTPTNTPTPTENPTPTTSPSPTQTTNETTTPTENPTTSPPPSYPPFDILQTKTGNIVFSWTKSIQNSQTFTIASSSATISVNVDLSLEMPVGVTAVSNATNVKGLNSALVKTAMTSQTGQLTLTINAQASVAGISQSTTQTLTKSFSSPIGTSSEIVFDTIAIPAIDLVLGKATIDLTPKFSLTGFANANFVSNGPCTLDTSSIQCSQSGDQTTMLARISEEKDTQISLTSPIMTISQINVGTNIGASIRPIFGEVYSVDLGSLTLPVDAGFQLNGSPSSTLLAEYLMPQNSPTPEPQHQQQFVFPMDILYIALAIAAIVIVAATVSVVAIKRRGKGIGRRKRELTI
jgi:hypothetical protein